MSSGTLRDAYRAFTTACALITTNGPRGPNVMAAEWTFNVSYDPFLIAVHMDPENATHDEILAAGEFGVNLASEDQIAAISFGGHRSKRTTDKLSSELFETYPGTRIRAPMLRGALLNAECRLVQHLPVGDHTMFVGEVLEFSVDPSKAPLVLHRGSHRLGERIRREPDVAVAATPERVRKEGILHVTGELTGPERAGQEVWVGLVDAGGRAVTEATCRSDEEGRFQGTVRVPRESGVGDHIVLARSDGLEGRARVEIV